MSRVIVCAAIRNGTGDVICSARHYDSLMEAQLAKSKSSWPASEIEEGFIDNVGGFYSRKEAYKVAEANGQIVRSGHNKELHSENLY